MRIGITCYPTYGGSGVVATELGQELAARGHDVHFISYAPPIRMNLNDPHIFFHEVEVASYPLFDHPPYALALATKMLEVFEAESLDLLHVHYAIPHSVSAMLARSMAAPRHLPFITTLHGTDITLVGSNRSYLPITKFSIEQSDGVTAISQYLLNQTIKEFDIKRPIEVIPNFVNCDLYTRQPNLAQRAKWAPAGEPILMHLSNFRPVKRITDTVEIFAQVRAKMPAKLVLIGDGPDRGAAEYLVRKKKLQKDVHFLGKQDQVYRLLSDADLFLLPSQLESFGLAALDSRQEKLLRQRRHPRLRTLLSARPVRNPRGLRLNSRGVSTRKASARPCSTGVSVFSALSASSALIPWPLHLIPNMLQNPHVNPMNHIV